MAPAPFGPWVSLLLLSLFATPALAQQSATPISTTSDPQAVALATKALAALTGGTPITDVILTGTATRTAGSDVETGTITLQALGSASSRTDFDGSGGNRTEIRNSSTGVPQGSWVSPDAASHAMASHNCLTDAVWFFPAFSVLSQISQPNVRATYLGQETHNGLSVRHLRFATLLPLPSNANSLLARLTTEDIYLDSSSLLPVSVKFNSHPDNDALTDIPVEIDFSKYQLVQHVPVPFTVRMLLNGSVLFDVELQSAVFNSGLSDSNFAIQ
ncbi:MAG: hypothetical protein ACRD8A_02880 [Candidatus Acidiferrales bacterium]